MEEMSYVFLFTSHISLPLIFSLHWQPLAVSSLSPPLQNFHVVLPTKSISFVSYLSLQISVALFLCRLLSLFLCLSLTLYSKFVNMTIYLSLILQTTRTQKQFPLSVFVFIDSSAAYVLQDVGGYSISLHMGRYNIFLPMLLRCAPFARESSAMMQFV